MPNARAVRRPLGSTNAPRRSKRTSTAPKKSTSSGTSASAVSAALARLESKMDKCSVNHTGSSVPSLLGRAAGTLLGNGDIGASLGTAVGKYFGVGDYEIKSNSLIKGMQTSNSKSSQIPSFSKDGRRGVRLTEREYIGDLVSSATPGAFRLQSFRINPADPTTFPWLSSVAAQFDEWEPHGLIFEFVSTSSEFNGTSQALGTVITATDYDPTDPAPTNKLIMEQYDYALSTRPSNGLVHGIECDMSERPSRMFYTSTYAPTTDARLTDLGNFHVATLGVSAASVTLGELWVSYDVTFYKKQLTAGQVGSNLFDHFLMANSGVTTANPLGISTGGTCSAGGPLKVTWHDLGGSVWQCRFPPNLQTGSYQLTYIASAATNVTITANPVQPLVNCALTGYFSGTSSLAKIISGSAGSGTIDCFINITGPNASFNFTGVTVTGAGGPAYFTLTQVIPLPIPWVDYVAPP